jgi:hypothetical protein
MPLRRGCQIFRWYQASVEALRDVKKTSMGRCTFTCWGLTGILISPLLPWPGKNIRPAPLANAWEDSSANRKKIFGGFLFVWIPKKFFRSRPQVSLTSHNIDIKAKCRHLKNWTVKGLCGRCLSEFIDRRYSQSCWYFRPSFVDCFPSTLLSGSPLPLSSLSCVNNNNYTEYT